MKNFLRGEDFSNLSIIEVATYLVNWKSKVFDKNVIDWTTTTVAIATVAKATITFLNQENL